MSKLKLFFVYFFVDVVIILVPIIGWSLINFLKTTLDFSYFAWYLLIIPIIVNMVIFLFLKKNSYRVVFLILSLIFVYIICYCLYIFFVGEAFSRLNF